MKHTTVPAQITTIEDRITGNLTLSQLILIMSPIFIDMLMFLLLPRFGHIEKYKIALGFIIDTNCLLLAVRVKGKILLNWLMTILRYNLRPRFYVFNKNTYFRHTRSILISSFTETRGDRSKQQTVDIKETSLSVNETVKLNNLLTNPKLNFNFKISKKAGLHVRITQIK